MSFPLPLPGTVAREALGNLPAIVELLDPAGACRLSRWPCAGALRNVQGDRSRCPERHKFRLPASRRRALANLGWPARRLEAPLELRDRAPGLTAALRPARVSIRSGLRVAQKYTLS